MSGVRRSRFVLCCVLLVMTASFSISANAQVKFDIPALPLGQALIQLGNQGNLSVLYRREQVEGLQAPALQADLTADDALARILAGTNLKVVGVDQNTVRVVQAETQPHTEATPNAIQRMRLTRAGDTRSGGPSTAESTDRGRLEEIVVTAQKREERLQNVPISISVMSGKTLDNSSYQGVAEALTTVSGVSAFPWSQGGGTTIAVRGVTAAYPVFGGPSPIAYYLDGVPFGLVDTAIAPDAAAYDLQRVEVLRGPQGTLYGASALNGVVRVLTNDANLNEFGFKARASGSGTQEGGANYRGDVSANLPIIDGKLAARAVIGYENSSGWVDSPIKNNVNNSELKNYRLKINAQPTDELSIGLSSWFSRQHYGAPSVANDQGRTSASISQPISTDYDAYSLKIGYKFSSFSVVSNTSYLDYRSKDSFDFVDLIGFDIPLNDKWGSHVFTEEINLNSTQDGPWRWAGGAIYRDGTSSISSELPAIATLDWTDTSRSYAFFGELARRFLDGKLEMSLGGRYFHDDVGTKEDAESPPLNGSQYYAAQASFHATTPRAVLTWHPKENNTIYASYSEGFRSGAPQAYYIVGGVAGFPAVKPDKLKNYEIGVKADSSDRRFSVEAALYYMDWRDVQQQLIVPFGQATVTALVNGKSASGAGVDFGLTARPIDRLELGITFSWNDLTTDSDVISQGQVLFAKGDRLNLSAKYTAGASGSYIFPLGESGFDGRISVSGNYTSPLSLRAIVGGAERTDLGDDMLIVRTAFSINSPRNWGMTIFADNITNEQGAVERNPSSIIPVPNTNVRVRPRTVGVQLDYRY